MADKKPEAKKPASAPASGGLFELETKIIVVSLFIIIIYLASGKYILKAMGVDVDEVYRELTLFVFKILDGFNWLFNTVFFLSIFISLLLIFGTIYMKARYKEVVTLYKVGLSKGFVASSSSTAKAEAEILADSANGNIEGALKSEKQVDENGKPILNVSGENKKWNDVEKHMSSMNSSDWRIAIIEADILLYEMLEQMGYDGATVADKLKLVESSDFNTLDLAWRAHKIRNVIAHEGASYALSYEQAKEAIDMYRKVFAEFYFI